MDKADLFVSRLATRPVETPIGTITIRSLSRAEALVVMRMEDAVAQERKALACALVDPVVTEADVARWEQAWPPLELEVVVDAVMDVSGLRDGAAKEAYKSVPGESGD